VKGKEVVAAHRDCWDKFLRLLYDEKERTPSDYTFSFSLGIQPKVHGVVILKNPHGPSRAELRERATFLRALDTRAQSEPTIYPVDYQPLTGEDTTIPVAAFPQDVCEDDPSFTDRDYRHPDPTDHGIQGVFTSPVTNAQLPTPKTKRIK
jgi:hypothetical protein